MTLILLYFFKVPPLAFNRPYLPSLESSTPFLLITIVISVISASTQFITFSSFDFATLKFFSLFLFQRFGRSADMLSKYNLQNLIMWKYLKSFFLKIPWYRIMLNYSEIFSMMIFLTITVSQVETVKKDNVRVGVIFDRLVQFVLVLV